MRARAARGQPGTVLNILLCKQINPLMRSMKAAVLLPFFIARSLTRFFAARPFSSLVYTDWESWLCGGERDHSRKQSALITIIFPVSSGFPLESVLVRSPLNKVDLPTSPDFLESEGGAVAGALFSHQCSPGSNLGVNALCGLSLLLVLSFAPRGFSPSLCTDPPPLPLSKNRFLLRGGGSLYTSNFSTGSRFFPLHKNQHFQIDLEHTNTFKRVLNLKNS